VDLQKLITGAIAAHMLPARAKSIRTEVDIGLAECWAEPTLLMRVLDNLYSNAVHYGDESGTIWVRTAQSAQQIIIEVANSGSPILDSEKGMIFEPFYQGSQQRKGAVKGSGLGLSIAQDCVLRMQGEIALINVDYAAVCFRISLPLTARTDK